MSDEKYQTFGQLCTNKNAVEEYLGREIPSKSDKMDNVEWLQKSSSDEWCGSALNKCADEIERLREENARLLEALKQFAERADRWDGQPERQILVMLSECRAAAAAIREGGGRDG